MTPASPPAAATKRHPIAVVAERTGLSQDLLRIWERRYDAVRPARADGGQRLYSDADVERLQLLRDAARGGRNISQIVALPSAALAELVAGDAVARERRADARFGEDSAAIVELALSRARELDAPALSDTLRRAQVRLGLSAYIEDVAAPLLHRVGEDWHAGRITTAHEHLVSATVHAIVVDIMNAFADLTTAPTLLVATPAGERHVIGAALVAAAATLDGRGVLYLGADLPVRDLVRAAREAEVRVVALSLVHVDDRAAALRELRKLRTELPSGVRVVLGGTGAQALESRITSLGIEVESSIPAFVAGLGATANAAT